VIVIVTGVAFGTLELGPHAVACTHPGSADGQRLIR